MVNIPKRALFKVSEVCLLVDLKPYVLRSWETEFPALRKKNNKSGARVYRRAEVELILQIKQLLFVDGLTLGAARRKLEEEKEGLGSAGNSDSSLEELFNKNFRERLLELKNSLKELLELLSSNSQEPVEVRAPASRVKKSGPSKNKRIKQSNKYKSKTKTKSKTKAKSKKKSRAL